MQNNIFRILITLWMEDSSQKLNSWFRVQHECWRNNCRWRILLTFKSSQADQKEHFAKYWSFWVSSQTRKEKVMSYKWSDDWNIGIVPCSFKRPYYDRGFSLAKIWLTVKSKAGLLWTSLRFTCHLHFCGVSTLHLLHWTQFCLLSLVDVLTDSSSWASPSALEKDLCQDHLPNSP